MADPGGGRQCTRGLFLSSTSVFSVFLLFFFLFVFVLYPFLFYVSFEAGRYLNRASKYLYLHLLVGSE